MYYINIGKVVDKCLNILSCPRAGKLCNVLPEINRPLHEDLFHTIYVYGISIYENDTCKT